MFEFPCLTRSTCRLPRLTVEYLEERVTTFVNGCEEADESDTDEDGDDGANMNDDDAADVYVCNCDAVLCRWAV